MSRSASCLSSSRRLSLGPGAPPFMERKYCPQRVRPASFFRRFSLALLQEGEAGQLEGRRGVDGVFSDWIYSKLD